MTTRRLPRLLTECLDGEALAPGDALLLSSVEGDEFTALLRTAAELRDRHKGRTVTFSPKVFIPLTNLCRDFCGYCTFRKAPGEEGARTLTLDEVLETVRRAGTMGCTEVLFSLGDKPEVIYPEMREFLRQGGYRRTLEYLYDACRVVLEETGLLPHANPGLMGRADLERLRQVNVSMGLMLESVSERLMEPGGPHADAPDKKPSARLRTLAEAGRVDIPFTTGILIGIGETWEERIASLYAMRELQQRYGHIQEVIVQNFRVKPEIPMRDHPQPDYDEESKTIALARLILGGDMNIQAPPNLTPGCYERYLRRGYQRLGRGFAGDPGLHQSRGSLARAGGACGPDRSRWFHVEAPASHLSGVHRPGGAVHRARAGPLRREVVRRGRPSVVSQLTVYKDAQDFSLSARRDDL